MTYIRVLACANCGAAEVVITIAQSTMEREYMSNLRTPPSPQKARYKPTILSPRSLLWETRENPTSNHRHPSRVVSR
jgi:hypothetical protein